MKAQKLLNSLNFADIVLISKTARPDDSTFPYVPQVCRCTNCIYFIEHRCTLKRCCCMKERVRAKSCTIEEILHDCFANIKDTIFRFRVKMAIQNVTEKRSCFLNSRHRKRFEEGCALTRRNDAEFIAQLFLLSASETLWSRAKQAWYGGNIEYSDIPLRDLTNNAYVYYCAGFDYRYGTSHADIEDICNDEIVGIEAFSIICYSIAICTYGINVLKIAEEGEVKNSERKTRKNGKQANSGRADT